MPLGESPAGAAFEVSLEVPRQVFRFESEIALELPRREFRGVGAFAAVVLGQTDFQIGGMSRVMPFGVFDAAEDVGVEHGICCYMDGLPSRSSGVFRPAFVLAHYGAAPSSAQGPLSLAPERRMVLGSTV